MTYPIEKVSSIPGSGKNFYLHLINNLDDVASAPHNIKYNYLRNKLKDKSSTPFRGYIPLNETYNIRYGATEFKDYTFSGIEKTIYFGDLSTETKNRLEIPNIFNENEVVFDPNFIEYELLPDGVRSLNRLPTLSLAKSISSWFLGVKKIPHYSEDDILKFLLRAFIKPTSIEMMYILHDCHLVWCITSILDTFIIRPNVIKEFYLQNTSDFYTTYISGILPSILYSLSMLGMDPCEELLKIKYLDNLEDGMDDIALYFKELATRNMIRITTT